MILADENIPIFIIESLRKEGFEVFSVFESERGIKDEQVIQLALQYNTIPYLLAKRETHRTAIFCYHYTQKNKNKAALNEQSLYRNRTISNRNTIIIN